MFKSVTNLLAEAEEMLTRAEAEGRDLDESEVAAYDDLLARAEKQKKRDHLRELVESGRAQVEPAVAPSGPQVLTRDEDTDPRTRALRAIDAGLNGTADEGRELLARAIDGARERRDRVELDALTRWTLVTGTPAYARAFDKLWRDPVNGHREFSAEELDAFQSGRDYQRAMALGGSGAYLLPAHLDPAIVITGAGVVDPMRQVCRNETVATETWNGVTAAQVSASWDGEAAQVSDDTPTLVPAPIKTQKLQGWIQASIEQVEDTTISSQVGALFADAVAVALGPALTTGAGAGSNQPKGIITAVAAVGGSVVAPTTAETYGRLDPRKVQEAVPARWRGNAKFMANLSIINATREFSRLASGTEQSLVDDSGELPRVQGWQLIENSSMDGTYDPAATVAHNYLLLAGDFKQYVCVTRVGTTVEYVPHVFGANGRPTGERGFYLYTRIGGDVMTADAFRLLDIPTTA